MPKAKGRAIGITNSEISIILWLVGFMIQLVAIKYVWVLLIQYPGIIDFVILIFLLPMSAFMTFMAVFWVNYLISKYDLFLWTDKITNPDFIGWIRCTRSKGVRTPIVRKGPLGQTKGVSNGVKANSMNKGDFTVTLPNGNQAILVHDMMHSNINLEENENWEMIQKHHGLIGFNAWEKAVDEGETLFDMDKIILDDIEEEKEDEENEEETTEE
jgi:hypothetical protein